jgi:bacillithiol synthase
MLCIERVRRGILRSDSNSREIPEWESISLERRSELIVERVPRVALPGQTRLYLDACSGGAKEFYALPESVADDAQKDPTYQDSTYRAELVELLKTQNPEQNVALEMLAKGAGALVTGQQVGLLGGPLFTPLKAATAIARARAESEAGKPHVPIFWLASEDHDFAEVNHTTLPGKHELKRLTYGSWPKVEIPVGGVVLDESVRGLVEEAGELIGLSETLEALEAAYQPGKTLAEAFAEFYKRVFAGSGTTTVDERCQDSQVPGLLILDPSGRAAHKLGARVLKAAIEWADELHAALLERNAALHAAGYAAQVAVAERSSLLFLLNAKTGAREALKRTAATARESDGIWQAGRESYTTADLLGILESEPERISPSALLRPVFQDAILPTTSYVGGAAEIAYFAQSSVLYEKILGRVTPILPRLSATLIEPAIADLMKRHEIELTSLFGKTEDELAQRLGARALPIEGKRKIAATGNSLDEELTALLEWMKAMDEGLGRSGERAASKMRYQMNRLRRLAARFALEKEAALGRHAQTIMQALYPEKHLQERVIGAPHFLARYGFELAENFVELAGDDGHAVVWL